MNHRDIKKSELIRTGVYATTFFELEVWSLAQGPNYTEKEHFAQLAEKGRMECGLRKEMVGLFPSYKEAVEYLEMMHEDSFDSDKELFCAFIREKAMCCMMKPTDYLKEWTYVCGLQVDESLVRNFAEEENPFYGRPKEMVRFKRGDIVMIPDGDSGYWGMVVNTPISPAEESKGLNWRDDSYVITTGEKGAESYQRVLAHHLISPRYIPDAVRVQMEEGR